MYAGMSNLSFRRSPVVNAYEVMAVSAYLRASGMPNVSQSMTHTDTYVETAFVVA